MLMNTMTRDQAKWEGHATFANTSETKHYVVDLSRTRAQKGIHMQLTNGDAISILSAYEGENGAIMVIYHNKEKRTTIKTFNGHNKDMEVNGSFILYYGEPTTKFILKTLPRKMDIVQQKEELTISIKLPNKDYVTICSIPFITADGGKSGTLDVKYHNGSKKTIVKNASGDDDIGFGVGEEMEIEGLFTLDYRDK